MVLGVYTYIVYAVDFPHCSQQNGPRRRWINNRRTIRGLWAFVSAIAKLLSEPQQRFERCAPVVECVRAIWLFPLVYVCTHFALIILIKLSERRNEIPASPRFNSISWTASGNFRKIHGKRRSSIFLGILLKSSIMAVRAERWYNVSKKKKKN